MILLLRKLYKIHTYKEYTIIYISIVNINHHPNALNNLWPVLDSFTISKYL